MAVTAVSVSVGAVPADRNADHPDRLPDRRRGAASAKWYPATGRASRSVASPVLRLIELTVAGIGRPRTTTTTATARSTETSAASAVRESVRKPVPTPVPEQVLASTRTTPDRTRAKTPARSGGGVAVFGGVRFRQVRGIDTAGTLPDPSATSRSGLACWCCPARPRWAAGHRG